MANKIQLSDLNIESNVMLLNASEQQKINGGNIVAGDPEYVNSNVNRILAGYSREEGTLALGPSTYGENPSGYALVYYPNDGESRPTIILL